MKLKVDFGYFGGELLVSPSGKATISREDSDFSVYLEQFQDKRIESLGVRSVNGLSIDITHQGWQISIQEDIWDTKVLVVKRYRDFEGKREIQYLMKNGKWMAHKGDKLPSGALRIPIFNLEKEEN